MSKAGKILSLKPKYAIPGGEVLIECEGLKIENFDSFSCFFNNEKARVVGASSNRVLAIVPGGLEESEVEVSLENDGQKSEPARMTVGKKIAENIHQVANPVIDPKDDSIILTRSGSRGQSLPVTLFRLEDDGYMSEMSAEVMNPTGLAFNRDGKLHITNRADGEVFQLVSDSEAVSIESELGVATGIAFDKDGNMYVGDRSGKIFKISEMGERDSWGILEPSVSAYHLAFGLDGFLYVTAPGLCSYDSIYRLDPEGMENVYFKGLGRPQGLAFDGEGNLYVAACFEGRHGVVKISDNGKNAELILAGMGIIGLCFNRQGAMLVATNDKLFSLDMGILGTLLS